MTSVDQANLTIALDAMSGDNDPAASVGGAVAYLSANRSAKVILVGRRSRLEEELGRTAAPAGVRERIEVFHCEDVIGMDEHPAQAVRAKKDASVVVACKLAAEGRAEAVVSAGNSGATLAAALFALRRLPGLHRPAIGATLPSAKGTTFVLDIGANTDCKPEWLLQFALMGDVFARRMMGVDSPRVGLLSNGEEAEKGSQLVQGAYPLLAGSGLNFVGNVEGRDLFGDRCDVAVTDGFTGNIALKTAEGVGEFLFRTIAEQAKSSLTGMVGGALLKGKLRPVRDRVDYRKTGGALLLGVAGEVVIAHGRSDAEAMTNALTVAQRAISQGVSRLIAQELRERGAAAPDTDVTGTTAGSPVTADTEQK